MGFYAIYDYSESPSYDLTYRKNNNYSEIYILWNADLEKVLSTIYSKYTDKDIEQLVKKEAFKSYDITWKNGQFHHDYLDELNIRDIIKDIKVILNGLKIQIKNDENFHINSDKFVLYASTQDSLYNKNRRQTSFANGEIVDDVPLSIETKNALNEIDRLATQSIHNIKVMSALFDRIKLDSWIDSKKTKK